MTINRYELVKRHNPVLQQYDQYSPLSIGNGEIAFTADITGLQSFPGTYENGMPLCTQAQWAWHTSPFNNKQFSYDNKKFKFTTYTLKDRKVQYPTKSIGQEKAYNWLRKNPHKFHLGRISLELTLSNGKKFKISDIKNINQQLDLWNGLLQSSFTVEDNEVKIKSCCHPKKDKLSFLIQSKLLLTGRMQILIAFPYGSPDITAADWANDQAHSTEIVGINKNKIDLLRTLDKDKYFVRIIYSPNVSVKMQDKNSFFIIPDNKSDVFEFSCIFSCNPINDKISTFTETEIACKNYWNEYWKNGGMIELIESDDSRAKELERRIILSQYLTAIQCSGSLPPQETGLTCNSWYGKFHLEMHWWHAVHFALWERTSLFEKSMLWYFSSLSKAKETALFQGYKGARWLKMTSCNGDESPSPINPLIIWQQPHPIYYSEIIYRSKPYLETLETYKDIVFETANFMASFVTYEKEKDRYILEPPIIPAQENHDPENTLNPTFELEYWFFGLKIANIWKERLGLKPDPLWEKIISKLSVLPIKDDVYLAHEKSPDTFKKFNYDHPSMLAAFGMLPGYRVDKCIMIKTLNKVLSSWQMEKVWGWDFPMIAMTAARLGLPELAIDALLYDSPKNIFLPNGHNRQSPSKDLPCYLPGNGGLLTAVAMMSAGWDNCIKGNAPGFPSNGKWKVKWENIRRMI